MTDPGFEGSIRTSRLVLLVLAYLAVLFVLDAGKDAIAAVQGQGPSGPFGFLTDAVTWWAVWLPLLVVGLRLAEYLAPNRVGWARSIAVNLIVTGLLVVVHIVLVSVAFHWMSGASGADVLAQRVRTLGWAYVMPEVLTSWGAVALLYAFGMGARLRAREIEAVRLRAAMSEARLEALRNEVRPHFLFNALNSVGGLIRSGRGAHATEMLDALAALLRRSLRDEYTTPVRLDEELLLLDHYVRVEKARWGDALGVELQMQEGLESAAVPPLVLQPIVENAICHGLGDGGTILVRAAAEEGRLVLEVTDPGDSTRPSGHSGSGIGLANTRERLHCLFGSEGSVEMASTATGGTRVRNALPLQHLDEGDPVPSGSEREVRHA